MSDWAETNQCRTGQAKIRENTMLNKKIPQASLVVLCLGLSLRKPEFEFPGPALPILTGTTSKYLVVGTHWHWQYCRYKFKFFKGHHHSTDSTGRPTDDAGSKMRQLESVNSVNVKLP